MDLFISLEDTEKSFLDDISFLSSRSSGLSRAQAAAGIIEKMSRMNARLLCGDGGEESRSVLPSFEAHFSEGDIRDMRAVEDGKKAPVEQGKIVPR